VQKIVIFITLLCVSGSVLASDFENAEIKRLMLYRDFPDLVFIDLELERTDFLSCHTNRNWDFILDISDDFGKAIYSALLSMRLSGQHGKFTGTGSCSRYSYSETLKRITM